MSERLVFELQAIDRATAPLKAVQAQVGATARSVDAASASMGRFSQQTALAERSTQRWAKGALQQAGYQVGDFFVQVTNGTNAMQAFGQQGAQLAGVFGPVGAVFGALIAIGSALYVAFDRAASASDNLSQSANNQTVAMKNLSGAIDETIQKLNEYRFGGSATAFAQNEIENIRSQVQGLRELMTGLRETETSGGSTGLEQIKAMFARDAAIEEFKTRKEALRVLEEKLQVLEAYNEAQRMLNGGLSVQAGISAGLVYDKQVELREAKELMKEHAQQLAYMGKTRQESDNFVSALMSAYTVLGNSRRVAAGLADEMARAAQSAVDPEKFKMAGAYQLYARTRLAAPEQPVSAAPSASRGAGGGGSMDPLKRLREQIDLERQLIGMTEAKQQVIKSLGDDWQKYDMSVIDGMAQQISEMDRFKAIASTIRESFSNAFMSMVDGTKSVKDAFKEMARNIIMKLYEVLVVQRLVNGITGAFSGAFPGIGKALGFMADGGTMQANRPYIVGERGPELMVPGRSSAVIPNDRLGGGGAVIVNQTINVSTGVQQTVRAEIKSLMPQIADSAKAAVLDAKRRGGAYGGAFA
jgi:hypothetical protein